MDMKKKILSSIILILICTPLFAMSMLHPGDVVKGKKITQTYFCFTASETKDLTLKLHDLQILSTLSDRQAAIEFERQRFSDIVASSSFTLKSKVEELSKEIAEGGLREKRLAELVKIEQDNVKKERRGRKRDRLIDNLKTLFFGAVVIYRGVAK